MSSLSEEVDMLRRVPLFAQIEPSKLKLLAFTSERLAFDANQDVFRQGDEGDAAYVIMQGSADVVVNTPKGETVVAVLSDNAFIGEIAILCDVPRTATIRAKSELQTLKIKKEDFLGLVKEFPDMAVEVMRELAARLGKTTAELSQVRQQLNAKGS
ncbi:MAG: Crp/Fnr family transcriptional regulator [Rhizobiales bacterium]|nr:Crp/Fnr family transcriptional regulator [Hyphomicrobiales bacterium]